MIPAVLATALAIFLACGVSSKWQPSPTDNYHSDQGQANDRFSGSSVFCNSIDYWLLKILVFDFMIVPFHGNVTATIVPFISSPLI